MRASWRAIRRLHDRAVALGDRATLRTLARRTFPREKTEGAQPHPAYSQRQDQRSSLGIPDKGRRNFRGANSIDVRSRLPASGNERSARIIRSEEHTSEL